VGSNQPASRDEDFHLGTAIYSSDGAEIGKLSRLIVDKEALTLRAFVAKESRRFSGHLLSPGSSGTPETRPVFKTASLRAG